MASLAGRAVIVTGAGSGIGRATAIAFAEAGANVLGVGRREHALAETARDHPTIATFSADLRSDGNPQRVVDAAIDRWERLDVLVNNAGAAAVMPLAQVTAERISDLFALNVTAPSVLACAALPYLRQTQGTIINISSTFGHRPNAGGSHYAATKAAIEHLTRSWALELATDGIRVNAIAPGPTESEALSVAGLPDEEVARVKAREAARTPLGRRGEPEEVAKWIVHFADPSATWLTGQILGVDGGFGLT